MAAPDVPAASLRSENCRVKSGVEMTPRAGGGSISLGRTKNETDRNPPSPSSDSAPWRRFERFWR